MTGCRCYIIFTPPVKSFEITQYKSDTYVFSSCPRGNEGGCCQKQDFRDGEDFQDGLVCGWRLLSESGFGGLWDVNAAADPSLP